MAGNARDDVAESLLDTQQRVGEALEQGLERDPTMAKLSSERERMLFWQRAIPPEQEALLWQQGVDPWEISTRVFPHRWKLMGMGRTTDTEKVAWLKKYQALGPPTTDADDDDGMAPAPLPSSLGAAPAAGGMAAPAGYPSDDDPALGYE